MHRRSIFYEGSLKPSEATNLYYHHFYRLQKGIWFHQQECHLLSSTSLWNSGSHSQCNKCTLQQVQECCHGGWKHLWVIASYYLCNTGGCSRTILVIILIDYLMTKATEDTDSGVVSHPRRCRRHPAKILNNLDFADDIALLESSIPSAQLTRTAAAAEQLDLITSIPKTEYMTINCNAQPPLQVYGQPIKHSFNFKYFESMMVSGINDQTRRTALAWVAFWKLEKIWKSLSIPHLYQN